MAGRDAMTDLAMEDRAESIRMIRDSAAAVAPREGDLRRIRELRFTPEGYNPAVWRRMGELGWIGLRLPEESGGAGLGMGVPSSARLSSPRAGGCGRGGGLPPRRPPC